MLSLKGFEIHLKKLFIVHILKMPTKFGVAPQSFCENQNSVEDQDQNQNHDFTLDFNTRPTFHTQKTPTKFFLDPLTPLKVIVRPEVKSAFVPSAGGKHSGRTFIGFICTEIKSTSWITMSKVQSIFFCKQ